MAETFFIRAAPEPGYDYYGQEAVWREPQLPAFRPQQREPPPYRPNYQNHSHNGMGKMNRGRGGRPNQFNRLRSIANYKPYQNQAIQDRVQERGRQWKAARKQVSRISKPMFERKQSSPSRSPSRSRSRSRSSRSRSRSRSDSASSRASYPRHGRSADKSASDRSSLASSREGSPVPSRQRHKSWSESRSQSASHESARIPHRLPIIKDGNVFFPPRPSAQQTKSRRSSASSIQSSRAGSPSLIDSSRGSSSRSVNRESKENRDERSGYAQLHHGMSTRSFP